MLTRRQLFKSGVGLVALGLLPSFIKEAESSIPSMLPLDPDKIYTFRVHIKRQGWVNFGPPNHHQENGMWVYKWNPPIYIENITSVVMGNDWWQVTVNAAGKYMKNITVNWGDDVPAELRWIQLEEFTPPPPTKWIKTIYNPRTDDAAYFDRKD